MFKNILNKTYPIGANLIRNRYFKLTGLRNFSSVNNSVEVYPDQVVDNLKAALSNKHEQNFAEIESQILENLHFFDSDQFVDIVSVLAYADKGTEALWDILSRKIFDYELDLVQSHMLDEALLKCNKHEYFMDDQIARDCLVWEVKWPKESQVFKKLL